MGVHIALSVVQLLHQSCGRIADLKRHRLRRQLPHISFRILARCIERVGFGRHGKINCRMSQMHVALRHSQEMTRLIDRHGQRQRLRICHTHVLAGKADQPPGDIQRFLPAVQHPAQPVYRRIRIAVPHGLVERRYEIVMFLSVFVVEQRTSVHALREHLLIHMNPPAGIHFSVQHSHLQRIQRSSGIPVGKPGDGVQMDVFHVNLHISQPSGASERMHKELFQILCLQRLQHKHPAPGQERGINLKGRIFRGGSHQYNAALFHIREKRVLLRLVEPVDLIGEEHRPQPGPAVLLRLRHHILDLPDPAGHCAELHEGGPGPAGDDPRQRGLPHSGRPPEDHGRDLIPVNELPQDLPRSQQMLLPHIFLQRLRPEPAGKGCGSLPVVK